MFYTSLFLITNNYIRDATLAVPIVNIFRIQLTDK